MYTRGKYILVNKKPVEVIDLLKWARMTESSNRRIALTEIGDIKISTVFLGMDFSFIPASMRNEKIKPLLFETMIFGGKLDKEMERYCTYGQAERGHKRWVKKVKESLDEL